MAENRDPLLPGEAEVASPLVPGAHIGAPGLGEDGDGLQIGEPVEGDGLGQRQEQLPRGQRLHVQEGPLGESGDMAVQRVRLLPELGAGVGGGGRGRPVGGRRRRGRGGGGGIGAVDAEGAVGAAEEDLGGGGLDGLDPGGAVGEELEGVVGVVHHGRRECRRERERLSLSYFSLFFLCLLSGIHGNGDGRTGEKVME